MSESRPLAPFSDEELVRRYRRGLDREGILMELYERYRSLTYGFFRRRIGVPEVAAEENQELYLAVMEHLGSFREESSFRTWLFQIAHYRLSHLRRRWGVHVDERCDEVPEALSNSLAAPGSQNPEAEASRGQIAGALRRCLAALPEIERAVVLGQYYEGVTLQELSKALELANPSGARALLIAAQRKLRRCLEQGGFDAAAALEAMETSS
ncbi:MAG TPA: RNA polymerase sigma factor [Candidatus Polarisedimenticolia bacterium]|nr:RNA polymerase sigma factor [Candidatus Polarisedimenticolia bacterium]